MPLAEILTLLTALLTALGPLLLKLFTTATTGGDVAAVLAAERVGDVLPATTRLELAMAAEALRRARADGHTAALAPAERVLVDSVLALHAELAALAPVAESPR